MRRLLLSARGKSDAQLRQKEALAVSSSFPPLSRAPIIAVLKWQAIATLVLLVVCGFWAGGHGGLSALLGGVVNASAVVVYWFVANLGLKRTSGSGLWPLLRAEIVKLAVVIAQIVIVFKAYAGLVVPAFFSTFLVTLLLWRVAFYVKQD
jgi:ATP synthase protein I